MEGEFAAHSQWGGRTVASRAEHGRGGGTLLVHLPGTFTVPQRYSSLLKYSASLGLDTIGLDYGWGPGPSPRKNLACEKTGACDACHDNYHDVVLTGNGSDLLSGPLAIFGQNHTDTLKFVHFFASSIQWVPETRLPDGVDLEGPLTAVAQEYFASMRNFSIEPLLAKVLAELGWTDYIMETGMPAWSKIVITGHSQGAGNAAHVAYKMPVKGALVLSGPQDMCHGVGAAWVAAAAALGKDDILGCYAVDEDAVPAIVSNIAFFTEVWTINTTGKVKEDDPAAWCPRPAHCATGTDDLLVEETVDTCFSLLQRFVEASHISQAKSSLAGWTTALALIAAALFSDFGLGV